jgi:hypothetical protein
MKRKTCAIFLFAAIMAGPVHAQSEKPILKQKPATVMVGDQWMIGRYQYKTTDLDISPVLKTDEWYMRSPQIDEDRSTYRETEFPLLAPKEYSYGLEFDITISQQGKLTRCVFDKMTEGGTEVKVDRAMIDKVCPMVTNQIQFYHALDEAGAPSEFTGTLQAIYSVELGSTKPNNDRPPMFLVRPPSETSTLARAAETVEEVTAATFEFTDDEFVFGYTRIDEFGAATACRLGTATYDDERDRNICARAMALKYKPALNEAGQAVSGLYFFGSNY